MAKARRRRRVRLESLVRDSSTPVFLISLARKVVSFNAGCEALTGWSADDIVGRVCSYVSDDPSDGVEELTNCLCPPPDVCAGAAKTVPVSLAHRDGRSVPRSVTYFPLRDEDGRVESILAIVSEIEHPLRGGDAMASQQLHAELTALLHTMRQRFDVASFVCRSESMLRVAEQARIARDSDIAVLLEGPHGTGKEHIARMIHHASRTGVRAFVPIDCASLAALEIRRTLKRLFASEREEASVPALQPGTFHLEHVEQLPRDLQEMVVAGMTDEDTKSRHCLRLMSSTTRGLDADSGDEPMRRDFYYLISPLRIELPALVERMEDLDLLAQQFLEEKNRGREKQVGGFSDDVLRQLRQYGWPGNLRELKAVVEEAWDLCAGTEIEVGDLPFRFRTAFDGQSEGPAVKPRLMPLEPYLEQVEREQIEEALRQCRNNRTKAADLLGIPRPRLYRRIEALGITEVP